MKKFLLIILCCFLIIIENYKNASSLSYKRHDLIIKKAISMLKNLEKDKSWTIAGYSNWKNKILLKEYGNRGKNILIIGGIHGDEPASVTSAIYLAKYLEKNSASIKNRVIIVPCLNPDGLRAGRRTNGHRIDLNRNFPSSTWEFDYTKHYNNPGPLPASEPETVVAIEIMDKYQPVMIIQLHQPFAALYPDSKAPNDLIEKMSDISGFSISFDIGYKTPGSLGSFKSDQEYSIIGITYELGRIDREPDYNKIILSLLEAINYDYN